MLVLVYLANNMPQNMSLTKQGCRNYTHCFLSLKNNETISLDNTLAESEWLVLSNEFIAHHSDGKRNSCQSEMVRIFNNELYLMLGKLATFGMILPVNRAAFK